MTQFYGQVLADLELKYGDLCPDTTTHFNAIFKKGSFQF